MELSLFKKMPSLALQDMSGQSDPFVEAGTLVGVEVLCFGKNF